jgi:3-oxoacyl-[acyl-carrier protein] reductase
MKNVFTKPDWAPKVPDGTRVLVTGASGGLGCALVAMLLDGSDCIIGAHGASQAAYASDARVNPLSCEFRSEEDCRTLVDEFVGKAGGVDALVVLSGSIRFSGHWMEMTGADWESEIDVNLNHPFFLARAAMTHMRAQRTGGRIVLTGTESALHGGSADSFPYAVAKRGTECLVQGLAREGAPDNILTNGVRLGYIASGFHQRWHGRSENEMSERADMVLLKRGGDPDEAAALITYLLSGWGGFFTGQMLPLTGGDWL